jgi:hypothetical protein
MGPRLWAGLMGVRPHPHDFAASPITSAGRFSPLAPFGTLDCWDLNLDDSSTLAGAEFCLRFIEISTGLPLDCSEFVGQPYSDQRIARI